MGRALHVPATANPHFSAARSDIYAGLLSGLGHVFPSCSRCVSLRVTVGVQLKQEINSL
jgi:hypothetical protein